MNEPTDQRNEQKPGGVGREPSDRWDFSSVPPPQGDLIPQLKEIPETPEERRRRRIILAISAVVAVIVAITAVIIILGIRHRARIDSAVQAYGTTGRAEALDEALERLEGEDAADDRALRARLLASAALDLGRLEAGETARELLEGLGGEAPPEAAVARVYLALAANEPSEAQQRAASVTRRGDHPAEGARAQALAAQGVGALPQAAAFVATAVDEEPGAPRYVALQARLLARTAQPKEALAALDGLEEDAASSPPVRLARARIAVREGDLGTTADTASEVLAEDAEATPVERAWAEVLLGYVAVERGRAAEALERVARAAELRPPGDEDFVLWRGRALLRAGAVQEAQEVLERLPEGVTGAPLLRSLVVAELALARGQAKKADGVLANATQVGPTVLLQGRAAAARGKPKEARKLYRRAADDSDVKAEAYAALARLELAEGNEKAAAQAAGEAIAADPGNADAVRAHVRAQIARGERDGAMAAVKKALAQRPDDGRLLAARARVEEAAGDWKAAEATLRQATEHLPRDADLFARLGEAARQRGQAADAKKAFNRALELEPTHPAALSGLLRIHVDAGELDEAGKILERIDEANVVSVEVDRARARYYVLTSAGRAGIEDVRRAIVRRALHDPDLWFALGTLQLQAGEPRGAIASFARTMREREGEDPRAMLGRARGQLGLRAKGGAERTLEDLDETLEGKEPSKELRADVLAAKAHLELLEERLGRARQLARQALDLDASNASAHLVLADLKEERKRDPSDHLRAALKAPVPPPEAMGRLALELEGGDERCELANAYAKAAPRGNHMRRLRRVLRDCR